MEPVIGGSHVHNMLQAEKAVHERIRILALSRIVYGSSHWNHSLVALMFIICYRLRRQFMRGLEFWLSVE